MQRTWTVVVLPVTNVNLKMLCVACLPIEYNSGSNQELFNRLADPLIRR